jgi:hypothetical protein
MQLIAREKKMQSIKLELELAFLSSSAIILLGHIIIMMFDVHRRRLVWLQFHEEDILAREEKQQIRKTRAHRALKEGKCATQWI